MPCSPGMKACAASCMHRSRVMDYRAERARQQDKLYQQANGYATEIADLERQARENSPWRTPYLTFKQHLIQTAIPPEMRDMPTPTEARDDGARFLRFNNDVQANEAYLLATALAGEPGVAALRVIQAGEFFYPEHQNIRAAILDLADQGLPHDAAAVTEELRARPLLGEHSRNPASQLPRHMDPEVPARTVDPTEWGLGAWQTHSPLPALAPHFAQNVRSAYRQRYLVDGLQHLSQKAQGSLTWDHTGTIDQDLLGLVREEAAYFLMDMPPMLDQNLQPVKSPDRGQSVTTWTQTVAPTRAVIADPTKNLHLPPLTPPQLSAAGQAVLRQASMSGRH